MHCVVNGSNACYRRFRDSVKEKLKHHQITYALENVINSVFRAKYWKMWGFYMAKRRMMKHHVHRRKMVTRLLCLERWKVFVALEKHIRRAGQQCIIRHSFRTWQKYIADMVVVIPVSSQFLIGKVVKNDVYEANPTGGVIVIHKNECYYDNLIDTFQNKLLKRKLFRYWREVCLRRGRLGGRKVWNDGELSIAYSTDAYLPWNTDEIIRLENTIQPTRVFLTNLLKHWKRVARATSEYHSITLTSVQIPNVIQKFHFRAWRESCMQLWSHRSRLIFRFFDNIRTLTTRVKDERYLLQMGISHFVNRYVKLGFENWINFVRDKKRFGNSGQTMRMSMFGTESQTFGHSIRAGTSSIAMNFQSPRAGSTFSRLTTSELSGSYFHTTGLMDTAADSPRSRSGSGTEFDYDAPLTPAQATPQLSVYKPALSTVSLLDRSICTNYSLTFRNVKLMRCALKHWYNRSVIVRSRQVASEELAIKYNNHYLLTFNGLRTLYAHCRRSKHNRSVAHRPLYQFVFRSWKKYAMQMKQEKVHLRKLSKYLVKKKRTTRKHCLLAWINYNTYNRKCIECAHSVKLKNLYNYMRIGFKTWKYQWSHALYWKIKELHVENKKVTDLIALYNDELSQLDKEKDRIIATSETYQSQIVEYTQLLINKECVLQETELKFNKQKEETLELQMAVQEKETMLRNVEVERDRLVSVEQVLLEESKRQAELMERRKEESDRMIRQLQEETANLQSELRQLATGETRDANSKTGGELVYSLEHKVKKSTEEELKILRELVSFNDNLRLEEKAQQQKLQQLEELRSEINKEIGDIQHRFHVLESGGSGGDEYASCSNNKELMDDRVMTNKTLHLNHLEEQLRQCDGKVQSTLNAIEEKKLALKALKSDTISKIEKR